jgi:hypothetical protein
MTPACSAYPRRHRPICPLLFLTTTTDTTPLVAASESCVLTMGTERRVSFRPPKKGTGVCLLTIPSRRGPALPPSPGRCLAGPSEPNIIAVLLESGGLNLGREREGAWDASRDSPRSRWTRGTVGLG